MSVEPKDLGGANLANTVANAFPDSCSGATAADLSTYFYNNGNACGWLGNTGSNDYKAFGYGYKNGDYYGKCVGGGQTGVGAFPGDANAFASRCLVCACF